VSKADVQWLPFKVGRWPWRNAEIPLTAFVGSLVSGFEAYSKGPRAVSCVRSSMVRECRLTRRHRYYKAVCPGHRERVYTLKTEEDPNGELDLQTNGQGRIHQLQVMLAGSDANCIRIEGSVFDDT
jgi:hypothetical protein